MPKSKSLSRRMFRSMQGEGPDPVLIRTEAAPAIIALGVRRKISCPRRCAGWWCVGMQGLGIFADARLDSTSAPKPQPLDLAALLATVKHNFVALIVGIDPLKPHGDVACNASQ